MNKWVFVVALIPAFVARHVTTFQEFNLDVSASVVVAFHEIHAIVPIRFLSSYTVFFDLITEQFLP
jgi:hypothetical protein